MAEAYFDKLSALVKALDLAGDLPAPVEVRHFFSGAALYAGGRLCASWTPAGLAFKLPPGESDSLQARGLAVPLRYFPEGPVKKDYALFPNPETAPPGRWRAYFLQAGRAVRHPPSPDSTP